MAIKFLNNVAVDSDVLYVDTVNNRVGIGTASPSEKLQVNGNIKFGGTTDKLLSSNGFAHLSFDVDAGFVLGDEDYNYSGVFIKGDSVNYRTDFQVDATTVMRVSYNIDIPSYIRHLGDTDTRFGFATNDTFLLQTAGSTRFYVSPTGNVGINTTTPGTFYKLNVNGPINANGSINATGFFINSSHVIDFTSGEYKFGDLDGAGDDVGIYAGGVARIYTDGLTGNVGIGTASPGAKLDVAGGVRVANDAAAASASNVGTLRYRTSGNNSYVDMCMQTGATTYAWVNIVQNNW